MTTDMTGGQSGYGTATTDTTVGGSGSDGSSAAGQVKDRAKEATHEAGAGAKHVAGVVGEEAGHVAGQAKSAARGLLHEARTQLSDQASTQKTRVADSLRKTGSQLSSMAENTDQGAAQTVVRNISQQVDKAAGWLSDREPSDIVDDVRRFARRNTAAFLTIAAGVGLLAGRLARSLASEHNDNNGSSSGGSNGNRLGGGVGRSGDTDLIGDTGAGSYGSGYGAGLAGGATGAAVGGSVVDADLTDAGRSGYASGDTGYAGGGYEGTTGPGYDETPVASAVAAGYGSDTDSGTSGSEYVEEVIVVEGDVDGDRSGNEYR
jgi:uncharacterized protein YjbJ (UPF0337 family)